MITGQVDADLKAMIRITVRGPGGMEQDLDAIVDTGYNGFVTVPPGLIASLGLSRIGDSEVLLADGRVEFMDIYRAFVVWNGNPIPVEADVADIDSLVGMCLLRDQELRVQVRDKGSVIIEPLP